MNNLFSLAALTMLLAVPGRTASVAPGTASGGMPFRPANSVEVSFVAGVLMTMDPVQAKISPETLESLRDAVAGGNSSVLAAPLVEAGNLIAEERGDRLNIVARAGEIIENRIDELASSVPGQDETAEGLEARIAALQSLQSIAKVYKTAGTRRLGAAIARARGQLEMIRARGIADAIDGLAAAESAGEAKSQLKELEQIAQRPGFEEARIRIVVGIIDDVSSDRLTKNFRDSALALAAKLSATLSNEDKGYVVALLERNMKRSEDAAFWPSLQRTIDAIAADAGGRANLDVPVLSKQDQQAGRLTAKRDDAPAKAWEGVPAPTEAHARAVREAEEVADASYKVTLGRWIDVVWNGVKNHPLAAVVGTAVSVMTLSDIVTAGAPFFGALIALPVMLAFAGKGLAEDHPVATIFHMLSIGMILRALALTGFSVGTVLIAALGVAWVASIAVLAFRQSYEDGLQTASVIINIMVAVGVKALITAVL